MKSKEELLAEQIKFYNSSEELPIKRFQKFNKYIMITSDVGGDFGDFSARIDRITQYINSDLKDEALREIVNFRQSLFNGLNDISTSNMALACLVKSIDGVPTKSTSDEELNGIIEILDKAGFTKAESDIMTMDVKKKSKWSLRRIFQSNSTTKEQK